jgi:two-component system, LytTR family, response regulator AlgR
MRMALSTGEYMMKVMIVDDEPLARQRMAQQLSRLPEPVDVVVQCAHAGDAWQWLEQHPSGVDVCFMDIQMPGPNGLQLAKKIATLPAPPLLVFVTAHPEHACEAFEVAALDYLTKPVRLERLTQTMQRCHQQMARPPTQPLADHVAGHLVVQDRQRMLRIAYADILFFKAEQKYVMLATAEAQYLIDESLNELQARLGDAFIRVHRNALVAKRAMQSLERRDDAEGHEGWAVCVKPVEVWLEVSRRQLAAVREALA